MNGTKKKSSLDYSLSLSKYNKLCLPSASLPQQIFMREPKEYCQTSAPQAYSQSLPLFISLTQTCQSYTTHKQILPNLGKSCSCNLNFLTGNKSCNVCGFLADPFSESAGMLADPACHSQTVQIGWCSQKPRSTAARWWAVGTSTQHDVQQLRAKRCSGTCWNCFWVYHKVSVCSTNSLRFIPVIFNLFFSNSCLARASVHTHTHFMTCVSRLQTQALTPHPHTSTNTSIS